MIVAVTVAEGRVGHGLGRAETVAVADVRDGTVQGWTEVDVHWGTLHDTGSEGEHHARIVRFVREHHIERVVAGGAGAGMRQTMAKMGVAVLTDLSGDARAAAVAAAGADVG